MRLTNGEGKQTTSKVIKQRFNKKLKTLYAPRRVSNGLFILRRRERCQSNRQQVKTKPKSKAEEIIYIEYSRFSPC
jgi:hypothetical protein